MFDWIGKRWGEVGQIAFVFTVSGAGLIAVGAWILACILYTWPIILPFVALGWVWNEWRKDGRK